MSPMLRSLSRGRARAALAPAASALAASSRGATRAFCSVPTPNEVQLLQQVSRLEARVNDLEGQLPQRVKPARITDWDNLGFGITPTNGHVRYTWSSTTNAWDAGQFVADPFVNLHIHSGVLHYGMSLFEGCKAFRSPDGTVRVCWLEANSARMNMGADRLVMEQVPQSLFLEAIDWAVRANAEYVPPYGSGGSLYIRPFLIGSGPILGLQPCPGFQFMVSVIPVGNYFGKGGATGIHAVVMKEYDRAAPRGTGGVKAGGNYAADLLPLKVAKGMGYGTTLYLDSVEQRYVEEFSVSNLIGISESGAYVTPHSPSILPSITNKMLMTLAADRGIKVEPRLIDFAEVPKFRELGACGTATVMAPIASITDGDKKYEFDNFETLTSLRTELQAIQFGEAEDKHGWMREVKC